MNSTNRSGWCGKWAGGRRRRNRNGDYVWIIEKMVRGKQYSITTKASNHEEAMGALNAFEREHGLRLSGRREYAASTPEDRNGVVYFIRCGGAVKIGFTTDIEKRAAALKTGAAEGFFVLGFVPGAMSTERRLHQQFSALKLHREWFRAAPELLEFIDLAMMELAA